MQQTNRQRKQTNFPLAVLANKNMKQTKKHRNGQTEQNKQTDKPNKETNNQTNKQTGKTNNMV